MTPPPPSFEKYVEKFGPESWLERRKSVRLKSERLTFCASKKKKVHRLYEKSIDFTNREQCVPHLPYSAALVEANINSVNERHCYLTAKLFKEILENHNNKLNHLIPKVNETPRPILRKQRPLNVPRAKTGRFFNSFIVSGCRAYNDSNNF